MTLRRLKWITVAAPLSLFAVVEVLRTLLLPELMRAWPGVLLVVGIVVFASLLFSETIFATIGGMQRRLEQQNRELLGLHRAGLGIAGELQVEVVLQKIVDEARELVGARYGALSVPGPSGEIESFVTSGISAELHAALGHPPRGHGLLGVVLVEGQSLRLRDLTRDPRAHGFPPGHPPMRSLLAVPVTSRERVLGNLYLTEKQDAPEFSAEDQHTLERFATQAAIAIENAHLHGRVRDLAITQERERIAREMHDSLAQVLGYVNTKAQAIQELLRSGQSERAATQVGQLADAARSAYADVREGILSLRTSLGPNRTLLDTMREYLDVWQEQSGIAAELQVEPEGSVLAGLSPSAELQVLRLVQEALANVRKHAAATRVAVRFVHAPDGVHVYVEDNGRGFDPLHRPTADGPRFGLTTMRERAEAVGGSLRIESTPGQGTRVIAHLPSGAVPLARA